MIRIKRKIHFVRKERGRKTIAKKPRPAKAVRPGRVPRISRLMALAIEFDGMVRREEVSDLSELARLCRISQPRMTHIMNLLHLAPDIQEEILFLPLVTTGRDPIHERMLRELTYIVDWQEQRERWAEIRPQ